MYLTVHLVLFAGAFVLFAWQLCTWRSRDAKRRLSHGQRSSLRSTARASRNVNLRDLRRPIEKPKSDVATRRRRPHNTLGDDFRPINRIHHYLY